MKVEITTLENGIVVATDPMPHIMSASIGVWVGCGARYETPREMGLSHMLEHMAFKGTARRTAKDIAVEIENVGGDLNAYTGREQTAYHARVLKDDVGLALDLISDILVHPSFDEVELARERDVIIQEIGQARDTPDDLIFDLLQEACYGDHAMGRPILGTEKTVASFQRSDLTDYLARNYRGGAMVLAGSGPLDHRQLVDAAQTMFAPIAPGAAPNPGPARFAGGERRETDDLEQAHLAFAFPGAKAGSPEAITAQVFATALGGGMSSRLFQEAREKRGLCYSIYAFANAFRDGGLVGVYAGVSAENAGGIAPIVAGEIAAMASGATEEEVARARAQLKASVLMGLESPYARSEYVSSHLFTFGRVLSAEELTQRIEAVDVSAVRAFASTLMATGNPALAAVGPVKKLESHDTFAARFGRAFA